MEFVISDACIFIDLLYIDLINEFFELPFEFYTTDFVVSEITNPKHLSVIRKFIDFKKLKVLNASPDKLSEIIHISRKHPKLSIADCSVFYFGKRNNLTVLTNDKRLRKLSSDIEVHGVLWVFDCLILNRIISKNKAITKLHELTEINQRLPMDECQKKIIEWRGRQPAVG